ncbi:MAG TPA: hypothetical protein EYQ81_16675 [Sneathiellales bacterium]|nr:hypothetical protein [Sneathiellales bacterium]
MPRAPKPGVLNVLKLRQIKCRKPANIAPIVELNFYFSPTGLKFSNMREKANVAAWMFERDISWLLAATGASLSAPFGTTQSRWYLLGAVAANNEARVHYHANSAIINVCN